MQQQGQRRSPVGLGVLLALVFIALAGGLGFLGWKSTELIKQLEPLAVAATSTTSTTLSTEDPWNGAYDLYQERLAWFIDQRSELRSDIYEAGNDLSRDDLLNRLSDLYTSAPLYFPNAPAAVEAAQSAYFKALGVVWIIGRHQGIDLLATEEWIQEKELLRSWLETLAQSR
mgnify:FL=1